ncbi:hypothetical protein FGO68_gene11275 [Halteria grandinella]|uniref:Uncharacterized protein n=1 Tax=Halteria grandinella TaxID=5974 RepID=A0A8J8NTH5_HALGN|nr:hypothetical protein FGO68_gene11275 [Halteria grandinella]
MAGGPMKAQDNSILNNQIFKSLIEKNFELGQGSSLMAQGVVDFCKNLTMMLGPVIETKEKENRKLKRLLKERILKDDDEDFLKPELKRNSQIGQSREFQKYEESKQITVHPRNTVQTYPKQKPFQQKQFKPPLAASTWRESPPRQQTNDQISASLDNNHFFLNSQLQQNAKPADTSPCEVDHHKQTLSQEVFGKANQHSPIDTGENDGMFQIGSGKKFGATNAQAIEKAQKLISGIDDEFMEEFPGLDPDALFNKSKSSGTGFQRRR